MKLAWIEDLLTLSEAGSFSRAALLRNVTQPAFSRRIQLLEAWLGVKLIDRNAQPLRLTSVAERNLGEFRRLLHDLNQLRYRMQSENRQVARVVLATQHSLTMTRLPPLIELLAREGASDIELSVHSENRDECVTAFMQGQSDMLLCMEEKDDLLITRMPRTLRLPMGTETLIPISAKDASGKPLHRPRAGNSLRLLAFPPDSFIGRVLYKECLDPLSQRFRLEIVHESVFLAGIKEMVLAGLGMAWLPHSLVRRELESGALVSHRSGLKRVSLELGMYRNMQPTYPDAIERIWRLLQAHPPA